MMIWIWRRLRTDMGKMLKYLRDILFGPAPVPAPKDGTRAAQDGFELTDNPYRQHTPEHSIWRDDWLGFHGRWK